MKIYIKIVNWKYIYMYIYIWTYAIKWHKYIKSIYTILAFPVRNAPWCWILYEHVPHKIIHIICRQIYHTWSQKGTRKCVASALVDT